MALTDGITAAGTVGAVVVAVGIAWVGNRRSDRLTAEERTRADNQLREERERSDRERRIERNVALLLEVYDLYADYKADAPDRVALFKLHARLAVLPWTVATLIRFATGETLLNDPESKKGWITHRAERPDVKNSEVGWDLLAHEFPADVWFLRRDQPRFESYWWNVYEKEHPPISGNVSPGVLPPHVGGI